MNGGRSGIDGKLPTIAGDIPVEFVVIREESELTRDRVGQLVVRGDIPRRYRQGPLLHQIFRDFDGRRGILPPRFKHRPRALQLMLELAREYNQLDIALYEFAVNEVFPRLCRKAGVDPAEKAPSYQSEGSTKRLNYQLSRVYNKLFRHLCSLRYDVILHDPRPRLGNTAQDIFGPLLQRDPARAT